MKRVKAKRQLLDEAFCIKKGQILTVVDVNASIRGKEFYLFDIETVAGIQRVGLKADHFETVDDLILTQTVKVSLSEIIHLDHEGFLDLLSHLTTNGPLLMDIGYEVVGIGDEPNTILLEVTGDTSQIETEESESL